MNALAGTLIFFLCGFAFSSFGAKDVKPNIIVFLVDDYDKPETSPYGGKVLDAEPRPTRQRGHALP